MNFTSTNLDILKIYYNTAYNISPFFHEVRPHMPSLQNELHLFYSHHGGQIRFEIS